MRTFKRIPLPDHEYLIVVDFDDSRIVFKRNYLRTSGNVYYTAKAEPITFALIQERLPDLWRSLDSDNILTVLLGLGFSEVDWTKTEFELYQTIA